MEKKNEKKWIHKRKRRGREGERVMVREPRPV